MRDKVESDSSVDDDCPPTLLISPQTIGLLFVQNPSGCENKPAGDEGRICGDG